MAGLPEPAASPPAATARAVEVAVAAVAPEVRAPEQVPAAVAAVPAVQLAEAADPPPPAALPAKPSLRREEIAMMIERGRVLFEAGDVAAARLFFRRAANAGDASAAFAMGATYDPEVLTQRFIRGIEADAAEAQKWYEKARGMGGGHVEMLAHR
jgi:TPR repeat protein